MHTQDIGTAHQGKRMEYAGAVQRIAGRDIQRTPNHRFARKARQQRQLKQVESIEPVEQFKIMCAILAEAKSRIDDDIIYPQ